MLLGNDYAICLSGPHFAEGLGNIWLHLVIFVRPRIQDNALGLLKGSQGAAFSGWNSPLACITTVVAMPGAASHEPSPPSRLSHRRIGSREVRNMVPNPKLFAWRTHNERFELLRSSKSKRLVRSWGQAHRLRKLKDLTFC